MRDSQYFAVGAILMLAAAAQRTSRLRLGTLITILSLYHPMRVIEEAVTLDQLSGGRLDLGVGRGVSPAELAFHGVSGAGLMIVVLPVARV